MEDAGTGAGHRAPPSVLRRLALGERVAARAVSHARVADAVLRRRAPKLLSASTRIAPPSGDSRTRRVVGGRTGSAGRRPWRMRCRWVPATPAAGAVAPARAAAAGPRLSEEAATFRSMMKQRYDMPDDMFDAMFGGSTPVYQGFIPTLPAPGAGGGRG